MARWRRFLPFAFIVGSVLFAAVVLFLILIALARDDRERQAMALRLLGGDYGNYHDTYNRPPLGLDDLRGLGPQNAFLYDRVQRGELVLVWGMDLRRPERERAHIVLGYERDAPVEGGVVLTADWKTQVMSAEELQAALKANPKPAEASP